MNNPTGANEIKPTQTIEAAEQEQEKTYPRMAEILATLPQMHINNKNASNALQATQSNNHQIAQIAAPPVVAQPLSNINQANVVAQLRHQLLVNNRMSTATREEILYNLCLYDDLYHKANSVTQSMMIQRLTYLAVKVAINPQHADYIKQAITLQACGLHVPPPPPPAYHGQRGNRRRNNAATNKYY